MLLAAQPSRYLGLPDGQSQQPAQPMVASVWSRSIHQATSIDAMCSRDALEGRFCGMELRLDGIIVQSWRLTAGRPFCCHRRVEVIRSLLIRTTPWVGFQH